MSRRFTFAILALALSAAVGVAQQAQHKPLHREQDPTKQSFADVERFRALFESSERDAWQKPLEGVLLFARTPRVEGGLAP